MVGFKLVRRNNRYEWEINMAEVGKPEEVNEAFAVAKFADAKLDEMIGVIALRRKLKKKSGKLVPSRSMMKDGITGRGKLPRKPK